MHVGLRHNPIWFIIALVILGNIWLFQALASNVDVYSKKVISNQAAKYDLEDL